MQFLISLGLTAALWASVLFFWFRYQRTENKLWLACGLIVFCLAIAVHGHVFPVIQSDDEVLACFHFRGNECF